MLEEGEWLNGHLFKLVHLNMFVGSNLKKQRGTRGETNYAKPLEKKALAKRFFIN